MSDAKNEIKNTAEYETLALAEHEIKKQKTNVYQPSDENVKEAKDWVDYNEK